MPSCKSIAKCAYCRDFFCQECTDAKNWQKFCSVSCEELAKADIEAQEKEDDYARQANQGFL